MPQVVSPSTRGSKSREDDEEVPSDSEKEEHIIKEPINDESLWKKANEVDVRGRDEEFDDYLADLLL